MNLKEINNNNKKSGSEYLVIPTHAGTGLEQAQAIVAIIPF